MSAPTTCPAWRLPSVESAASLTSNSPIRSSKATTRNSPCAVHEDWNRWRGVPCRTGPRDSDLAAAAASSVGEERLRGGAAVLHPSGSVAGLGLHGLGGCGELLRRVERRLHPQRLSGPRGRPPAPDQAHPA